MSKKERSIVETVGGPNRSNEVQVARSMSPRSWSKHNMALFMAAYESLFGKQSNSARHWFRNVAVTQPKPAPRPGAHDGF